MKKLLITLTIAMLCALSFAQNTDKAPKIVSTTPEFADYHVDHEIKEVVIKFDQDMSNGMSVVNTANMPKTNGRSKWVDKRTLVIPVTLYPNKLYSIALNNSRYQNFKSALGVPLNPEILHFKTKPICYKSQNKKAYKELVELFPKKYSYADRNGIDWKKLLKENKSDFVKAKTDTEFFLTLLKLLRKANDPHLWIDLNGQRFSTYNMKIIEKNHNAHKLFMKITEKKVSKGFGSVVGVIDNVGYFSMKSWNKNIDKLQYQKWGNSQNPKISSETVYKELFKHKNIIVDVRGNSGGNESFAKQIASYFVKDSLPYEKVVSYDEKTGKFSKERIKKVHPNKNGVNYTGNIYVLSGSSVMSSNESFILMMKQLPNAKIVGMKTYGSTGNPKPHKLSNGVTIYLPSWQAYTLDGKLIEGNGISPDIEIKTTKEDFKDEDKLVEKVLDMIKGEG